MRESGSIQKDKVDSEISIFQLLEVLWFYRVWVASGTAIALVVGLLYAFLATPVYNSQATIALKENKGNDPSRLFSQLGGVGGAVASQLGGNSGLEKLEIILKSHDLADSVIRKNNLLPVIFPERWNAETRAWKSRKKQPSVRLGVERMRSEVLSVGVDVKKGVVKITASAHDSVAAQRLVLFYLKELNEKMRTDVMKDAEASREYLEMRLSNTRDPLLMETIQRLIGYEIEKYMLVSNKAFDVLEGPVVPIKRAKPQKKVTLALSLLLGFVLSSAIILLWKAPAFLKKNRRSSIHSDT